MRVGIVLRIAGGGAAVGMEEEVACLEKATGRAEDVGLSLAEGKALLAAVQRRVVQVQAAEWTARHRRRGARGAPRRCKGSHSMLFRTLYGDVRLASPRLHRCPCRGDEGPATTSPLCELLPAHVAPERLYLEARWASLVPYAAAARLLADVLPAASGANATTVRRHAPRVAERAEAELGEERASFAEGCPAEWAALPIPEGRIAAGLDGGYVRDRADRRSNFELIVGRSVPEDRPPRYLGLVHGHDRRPRRRLFEVLREQGLQASQDVAFLTDGGEEVRALTELVTPEAEHVLDWFHVAMRLTALGRYARGVAHHDEAEGARLLKALERLKWLLWHGDRHRALRRADDLRDDVECLDLDYPHLGRFARAAQEFGVCLADNRGSLVNYGERHRAGGRISSALAEGTVNAVAGKRFAKRQQMQWSKRGAHLLLQTRTRALDGALRPLFERWYPGSANDTDAGSDQAVAA